MGAMKSAGMEALTILNEAWQKARNKELDIEAQIYYGGFYDGALCMLQDALKQEVVEMNGEHFIMDGYNEDGSPNIVLRA